ncbi:MAG: hypothetical protein KF729_21990 [Sandaracinaceae bacterium]|nr:hypothetical protein [Sandaracinaceae bacterium]
MSEASPEPVAPDEGAAAQTVLDPDPPPRVERRRYRVGEREGRKLVVSGNAPNVELYVERGLSVDGAGRKRFGAQTIFLDGVYVGAPFCDNEARQYSLDHHAGCVRAFTLATCEQAVVMLLQGLPLASGTWTIWINDPDLDSMLAAWVLMNHVELLRDDRALLKRAMPAIRLEGVIDAHGTDRDLLTGLPDDALAAAKAQLDRLMAEERRLKSSRQWMQTSWIEYACDQLERMDDELLPQGALDALLELQELGRAALFNQRIAVLLESTLGIYEVEERLKDRYGAALGVIVLRIDKDRYTLRLVDAFLPKNLDAVYRALNRADPRARTRGARPNAWGGSGDIGGSPREGGTGLSGPEILAVLADVLGPHVPWWRRLFTLFLGLIRGKSRPAALPPRT